MRLSKTKPWKMLAVSLTAALSIAVLSACGNSDDKEAVATYKGGEVTAAEFNKEQRTMKFLSPEYAQLMELPDFQEYMLKQEIAFEYLESQAGEEAKKAGEEQADKQMELLKQQRGDDAFKSSLKEQDLKEADVKAYMVRLLTVIEDMKGKVTEDEVKKEFENVKDSYTVATLRHVLIGFTDADNKQRTPEDALKRANEVKAKLDGGADFAAVAKEYTDDTASKETGGLITDKPLGSYVEEFKAAAATLPLGTVSDPVETQYGYHIIKVESRTEKTYDQLAADQKEMLKSSVATAKVDNFMNAELDGIIEKINLPKSSAAPAASDAGGTGAEPSPAASAGAATAAPAGTAPAGTAPAATAPAATASPASK